MRRTSFRAMVTIAGFWLACGVGFAFFAQAGEESGGKALFLEKKCNLCHSIASQEIEKKLEKMQGGDLSEAGNSVADAKWLKRYLLQNALKDQEKHRRRFKGEEPELETLVNWIITLKSGEAAK